MNFNDFLHLLSNLLVLAFILLPFVYLIPKSQRWSQSIAKSNARPPKRVRLVEVTVLGIFALVLVLHIATGGIGRAGTPLPAAVTWARAEVCGAVIVIAAFWMALGAWRSVALAAGGMIVSASVGTMILLTTNALSYERFEDEIRKIPVPVEITLQSPISDVDVFINGIRMGQAPLHTTLEEIAEKAPEITLTNEEERRQEWKNFGDQTYLPQQKVSLDDAHQVTIRSDNREREKKKVNLYVRFERKGEPLLVLGSLSYSSPSRMFGQIQPARIPFDVMTEAWDRDVTLLLDKARLADYHVDADWIAAADTYSHFVRNAILRQLPNEPQFQQVLNDWAAARFHLDRVTDTVGAWRVFEAICSQANERRRYNTDSIEGEAVELLLDKLDAEQLITQAQLRLTQILANNDYTFGWGWHDRNGRRHFNTGNVANRVALKPRDFVLAHAVWRLDQKWDAAGVAHDNPAERRLMPLLLQLIYLGNQNVEGLASALGGTTLDEFNRRQQRSVRGFEPNPDDFSSSEYIGGKHVSRNFWRAINSQGPAGASYRKERSWQILEFADWMLADGIALSFLPSNWTDFLFLDVEGREPLAKDFWERYRTRVSMRGAGHNESLKLQWSYLAQMRPLPEASEFVAVFSEQARSIFEFQSAESALSLLPPDVLLDVAKGCMFESARQLKLATPNSESHFMYEQIGQKAVRFAVAIPSEAAADFAMEIINARGPDSPESSLVKGLGSGGSLTPQLFSRLAASPRTEHRHWVLRQIRIRPDKTSRDVLTRLLDDENQSIRESAESVADELEKLRQRPLPRFE